MLPALERRAPRVIEGGEREFPDFDDLVVDEPRLDQHCKARPLVTPKRGHRRVLCAKAVEAMGQNVVHQVSSGCGGPKRGKARPQDHAALAHRNRIDPEHYQCEVALRKVWLSGLW